MTLLGVPAKDTDEEMQAFVDRHGLGAMPQLVDDDDSIWTRFGVRYQPAWVFISPDGTGEVVAGALGAEALDERLAALAGAG